MRKLQNNFAFIDSTNLHKGVAGTLGWNLDYQKFRVLLAERYGVKRSYMFMGFIPTNANMYNDLQRKGYEIIFKPTIPTDKSTKGNCDAELVLQVMIDFHAYDKAVIVTGDGDFHCLIDYLQKQNKLEAVISPNVKWCSSLIKRLSNKIRHVYIEHLRTKLEYMHEKAPK